MSALEQSLEKSNIWLNTLQRDLNLPQQKDAYRLLKVVLHSLRDRLPLNEAAQLGAQLPTFIRGLYYEGFKPGSITKRERNLGPFLQSIEKKMPRFYPKQASEMLRGVFSLLNQFISPGEIADIKACCNEDIRRFWPETSKKKKAA
jgi:uncharacterized protein (DUF2267 family)